MPPLNPQQARVHIERELLGPKAVAWMERVMNKIRSRVIKKLTGDVLAVRSGRLRNSIVHRVRSGRERLVGEIGTNVFYGRIWELTGHKAFTVRPVRARALAIPLGRGRGKTIFRMLARIPAEKPRPFIKPAIEELQPEIRADHERRFREATNVDIHVRVGKGKRGPAGE